VLQFNNEATTNDSDWVIDGSSKARLVTATPDLDRTVGYVARVSSKNQENPSVSGLLRYCAKFGHWSVFEQGSLTIEVVTPLAIAIQLLRHRSFCFQQFSGRYQDQKAMTLMTDGLPTSEHDLFYMPPVARMQDTTNRQNSIVLDDDHVTALMQGAVEDAMLASFKAYNKLLTLGIAKEVARFVLPQGTYTRLYVTGNARSFIHYCDVRDDEGVAQLEHVELARAIRKVFAAECPLIAEAVWH
jgi:thymidylate synthase (FAD)